MVEYIRQHHPHMRETEVTRLLNRASDVFCSETEILKKTWTQTTGQDGSGNWKRYYPLDSDIVRVIKVSLGDESIPRMVNPPLLEDEDYE